MENRSSRLPDETEIAQINARHLIATPLKPADLLFVFGTREDVERRVDEAVRLWREGFFQWSIVSGGVTPGATLSECEIIKAAMLGRGIPADRILEEHRAMNTGENVMFSLPVIESTLCLKNIRSVICLGNSWTARRYPMTLHRHWAGGGEAADHGRQFCHAACALAHLSGVANPDSARMGQD